MNIPPHPTPPHTPPHHTSSQGSVGALYIYSSIRCIYCSEAGRGQHIMQNMQSIHPEHHP